MRITVLSVSNETVPTTKGSYQKLEVAYKGEDGQVKGKKLVSFGSNAPAFKVLQDAEPGEFYEVTSVKEGEYWQWTNAEVTTGEARPETVKQPTNTPGSHKTVGGKVTGSNYETPEERAKKQVYIVRQSSVTAALTFLNGQGGGGAGKLKSTDEVIQVAKQFEAYVFSNTADNPPATKIADMEDDIPL